MSPSRYVHYAYVCSLLVLVAGGVIFTYRLLQPVSTSLEILRAGAGLAICLSALLAVLSTYLLGRRSAWLVSLAAGICIAYFLAGYMVVSVWGGVTGSVPSQIVFRSVSLFGFPGEYLLERFVGIGGIYHSHFDMPFIAWRIVLFVFLNFACWLVLFLVCRSGFRQIRVRKGR